MMRLKYAVLGLIFAAAACGLAGAHARAQELADPQTSTSASPVPIPSPQATTEDPKVHKLALEQFLAWQQGSVDKAAYTDNLGGQLTDDFIQSASESLSQLGALQKVQFGGISHASIGDVYVYHMVCEKGAVDMDFALAQDGRISQIFFQ